MYNSKALKDLWSDTGTIHEWWTFFSLHWVMTVFNLLIHGTWYYWTATFLLLLGEGVNSKPLLNLSHCPGLCTWSCSIFPGLHWCWTNICASRGPGQKFITHVEMLGWGASNNTESITVVVDKMVYSFCNHHIFQHVVWYPKTYWNTPD